MAGRKIIVALGAAATMMVVFPHPTTARAAAPDATTTTTTPSTSNPSKQACIDAATRGQIQRDDGKLSAAAEAFAVCSASTCPVAIRKNCTEWLAEAKQKMPRVTIQLDPSDQADAAGAIVTIDGNRTKLDTVTTVDPGRHSVSVERPDHVVGQDFTIAAGETKTIVMHPPAPPKIESKPEPITKRPIPTSVFVLGGVAIVGVASWAVFGLMAKSDTDRLLEECAPGCAESDKDSAFVKAVVADVSLGVAALATVGAGILFFTRPTITVDPAGGPPSKEGPSSSHLRVEPAFGFGRLGIRGSF